MSTQLATVNDGPELMLIERRQPLDQCPAAIYLAGLKSAKSRATMQEALDKIAALLAGQHPASWRERKGRTRQAGAEAGRCFLVQWQQLRPQHARLIQTLLAVSYSPATANKMRSALRGTLKAAQSLIRQQYREAIATATTPADRADLAVRMQVDQDALGDVIGELKDAKAEREETDLAGRALTRGELRALLSVCANDPTPAGIRDASIIAIMYACGPRRSEVAALDLADLIKDGEGSGWLVVRHGKGDKTRKIPVTNGAYEALQDWLSVRGDEPGALFVAINKGGRLTLGENMTAQAIFNMLLKRGKEANIPGFSPHDMRRTFISDLLDAGADIVTVQKLAGHANPRTTARYDRRGDKAKRKAVDLLSVPYTRRRLA